MQPARVGQIRTDQSAEIRPVTRPLDASDGPRVSVVDHKGNVLARLGKEPLAGTRPGQFLSPHGLAVDSHGDIYVGEVSFTNWRNRYRNDPPPPPGLRSLTKLVKIS